MLTPGLPGLLAFPGGLIGGSTIAVIVARLLHQRVAFSRTVVEGYPTGHRPRHHRGQCGWALPRLVHLIDPHCLVRWVLLRGFLGFSAGTDPKPLTAAREGPGFVGRATAMRPGAERGLTSTSGWRAAKATLAAGFLVTCTGILTLKPSADGPESHAVMLAGDPDEDGPESPSLRGDDYRGQDIRFGVTKRRSTLGQFYASWCGSCNLELARLEPEVWQKYRDSGLAAVVIGRGEQDERGAHFPGETPLYFPNGSRPGPPNF